MGDRARSCRASAPARARSAPPKCWPIAWWPRQTPSSGRRASAQAATRSSEIPASSGVPGPGEIRIASAPLASASAGAQRVVALDPDLGPDLPQIMDEVPGEAVIIVDDEDHAGRLGSLMLPAGGQRRRRAAWRGARRAIASVVALDARLARLDRAGELLGELLARRCCVNSVRVGCDQLRLARGVARRALLVMDDEPAGTVRRREQLARGPAAG